ncbi:MAG: enoyl-CoA hydratase/isomerase family protein [Thermaceae bacterium]
MPHEHEHEHEFVLEIPAFEHLSYEVEDGVALVTLRRPEALNALNQELLLELSEVTEVIQQDPEARVVIFAGEGRAFAAGADLKELSRVEDAFQGREAALFGQQVFSEIAALPLPTIAAIHGYALGGGLELALACDLRVASKEARLGLPEVGLGLIPGYGGTQRLPRLIGRGRALDLIFTGRHVSAEEALQMGLVNRVGEDALEEARKLARQILKNAPIALALAKESVVRGEGLDLQEALEIEADLFGFACTTKDMKEGVRAFFEKRAPEFKGE